MIGVAALQEDVDAVGLSVMSGAHNTLFPAVIAELRQRGLSDVVVFGGGIVPDADLPTLAQAGVRRIFQPGTPLDEVVAWVREHVRPRV
jgi:methylmalonyl-CoA mutase C-terminal domain/subunit